MSRIASLVRDLRAVIGIGVRRLPYVLVLMLAAAALDLLGVALIAPFLSLSLSLPGQTMPPWISSLENNVGWLGVSLVIVFALKGWAAFRVQKQITLTTDGIRAELMTRLLDAYQRRPYEFHLRRNSSDLVNTVLWHTQAFTSGVVASLLQMIANGLVFAALAILLLKTSIFASLILVTVLAVVFVLVARVVRPRLVSAIQTTGAVQADAIQSVTQALAAWREIRILGREESFLRRMRQAADLLATSSARQASLQLIPRQAIECAVVAFLVGMAWLAHSGNGGLALVPVLGTFAAAALRLLPASTSLLSSFNLVRANRFIARKLAEELSVLASSPDSAPAAQTRESEVFRSLVVDSVKFAYSDELSPALNLVSLRIEGGEVVGLMGRSGAGKSTLADVVLGFLAPQEGRVLVNGFDVSRDQSRWHQMVAYIPQSVCLIDDSLRRNIALGVPDLEIEEELIVDAVKQAQLGDLVATLPLGLDTVVGERGVRLSGGQRQRVAIARALYHDRQFLILDEATSALDSETERAVVDAIGALAGRKSMLVIAHRESTLGNCDRIVRLEGGRILTDASPLSSL